MNGLFSKKFHRQTDFDYAVGTPPLSPQYWPKEWTEIYHKEYSRMPHVELSKNILDLTNLKEVLVSRHASREYDLGQCLTFDELSTIVYYSAGVNPARSKEEEEGVRRFYPSGGARYPLEAYFLVQRVEGLTPGIYHYNVKKNALEILSTDKDDIEFFLEGLYYPWSRDAAVVYVITSVWERNFMKYKDRGYRITLMEAGHLAHNISLVSSSLKIKCCNSVGFHNGRMNEALDIDRDDEDSLYIALLGK